MGNVIGNEKIFRATVTKEFYWSKGYDMYNINYKDKNGKDRKFTTYDDAAKATLLINKYFHQKNTTITPKQVQSLKQDISTTFPPQKGGKFVSTDWYKLLRDALDDFLSDDQKITPNEVYQIYERIESGAQKD